MNIKIVKFLKFEFRMKNLWSFEASTSNELVCQRFPELQKFKKPTELMIVQPLKINKFYQMPYQSHSITRSKVVHENTWSLLPAVKLISSDFMIEMFVRQKTISPCDNLKNLPDGEFLRIGNDFNENSKFLTFNKKSGNRLSITFNGANTNSDDFIFRNVFKIFIDFLAQFYHK